MKDYEMLREVMRRLVRKLGLLQKNDSTCCGVTLAQCHALTEIGRAEGITLVDLAETLNLDKSTMSRTVDGLVNNELVNRKVAPGSRRTLNITLTDKGTEIFNNIENGMNEYFASVLSAIPHEKRSTVAEAMVYLNKAIQEQKSCCS